MLEQPVSAFAEKTQGEDGVARHELDERVRHLDPAGRDETGAEVFSSIGHSAPSCLARILLTLSRRLQRMPCPVKVIAVMLKITTM